MNSDIDLFAIFQKIMEGPISPRELFFAGFAFGALHARLSQEEIVKIAASLRDTREAERGEP